VTRSVEVPQVETPRRWPWRDDCGSQLAAEFGAILRDTLSTPAELTVQIISVEVGVS
jgi:hypothetical protein